jgi:hypothetical protein
MVWILFPHIVWRFNRHLFDFHILPIYFKSRQINLKRKRNPRCFLREMYKTAEIVQSKSKDSVDITKVISIQAENISDIFSNVKTTSRTC